MFCRFVKRKVCVFCIPLHSTCLNRVTSAQANFCLPKALPFAPFFSFPPFLFEPAHRALPHLISKRGKSSLRFGAAAFYCRRGQAKAFGRTTPPPAHYACSPRHRPTRSWRGVGIPHEAHAGRERAGPARQNLPGFL